MAVADVNGLLKIRKRNNIRTVFFRAISIIQSNIWKRRQVFRCQKSVIGQRVFPVKKDINRRLGQFCVGQIRSRIAEVKDGENSRKAFVVLDTLK